MALQESGEMYLEAIYVLSQKKTNIQSIDVGAYLGYSKPSVSRAIGILKNAGYVVSNADGFLELTAPGREIAERIYERHTLLTELFMGLGVSEETASADACRIEHVISAETFEAIKRHAAKKR